MLVIYVCITIATSPRQGREFMMASKAMSHIHTEIYTAKILQMYITTQLAAADDVHTLDRDETNNQTS